MNRTAPTPTAVLRMRGSWRAKARAKAGEPPIAKGFPRCPADLPLLAKRVWRRIEAEWKGLGLIGPQHKDVLAEYCQCIAECEAARKIIAERGMLIDGEFGPRKNPACMVLATARQAKLRYAIELGLTPAANARLRVPPKPARAAADKDAVPDDDDLLRLA